MTKYGIIHNIVKQSDLRDGYFNTLTLKFYLCCKKYALLFLYCFVSTQIRKVNHLCESLQST